MSIVGIDPNVDDRDYLDPNDELELGPDQLTPDYSHFLLGFVRDPNWIPVWRRNRGPRAYRDYSDPPYDPDYDPRSLKYRYRQIEKQPQFNFPIEKLAEKQKELETLPDRTITPEMEQRWLNKYGPRWKEATAWLFAYEREAPPVEDPRSNWQKKQDERQREKAENYVNFALDRIKTVKKAKKKLVEELKNENHEFTPEEQKQMLQKHILPPIKEEELIQRGILDKQDSYENENTVFFPWKRQELVLNQMQKEFDKGLILAKKEQLETKSPQGNHPYAEYEVGNHNPYPAISEETLHQKCGHALNGLKLCKVMAENRMTPKRQSCAAAATTMINCMTHQFCQDEMFMIQQHCGRKYTRVCALSQDRYMACLGKVIPPHSDVEL